MLQNDIFFEKDERLITDEEQAIVWNIALGQYYEENEKEKVNQENSII